MQRCSTPPSTALGSAAVVSIRHSALLALGNLLIKGGSAVADTRSNALACLVKQLRSLVTADKASLSAALDSARLLSAALRALVPLLATDSPTLQLHAGELLRVMQKCMLFGTEGVLLQAGGGTRPLQAGGEGGDAAWDSDSDAHGSGAEGGVPKLRSPMQSHGRSRPGSRRPRRRAGRGIPESAAGAGGGEGGWSDGDTAGSVSAGGAHSGSDISVANTGGASGGRARQFPLRVRIAALQGTETLARTAPKQVQAVWHMLLPQSQALHPRPDQATLATVLLFDPSFKAREAASRCLAAVLAALPVGRWVGMPSAGTGPRSGARGGKGAASPVGKEPSSSPSAVQRARSSREADGDSALAAFLASAGAATSSGAAMSDRVVATVIQLHVALRRALQRLGEAPPSLCTAVLQCLGELVSATPYGRFPAGMLTLCVPQLLQLLQHREISVVVSTLQCLGTLLSTKGSLPEVADIMLPGAAGGLAQADGGAEATQPSLLHSLLQLCSGDAPLAVRTEVLSVIAKGSRHYSGVVSAAWVQVQPLLLQALADSQPHMRASSLKVLEELLRARAGTTALVHAQAAAVQRLPTRRLELQGAQDFFSLALVGGPDGEAQEGDSMDVLALVQHHFPRGLQDTTAAVRSSACMCLSYVLPVDWAIMLAKGVKRGSFEATNEGMVLRDATLSLVVTACSDSVPSVRVAAARALGAFACFRDWKSHAYARVAGPALLQLTRDSSLNVRVKAVWALGNLCATPTRSTEASTHSASTAGLMAPSSSAVTHTAGGQHDEHATAHETGVPSSSSPLMLSQFVPLPFLRRIALALLAAGADNDRVSSAAVRTLGLVVKGLVEHLYPRDAFQVEVAADEMQGNAPAPTGSGPPRAAASPFAARAPAAPSSGREGGSAVSTADMVTPPARVDGRTVVGTATRGGFRGDSSVLHLSSAASPFETPQKSPCRDRHRDDAQQQAGSSQAEGEHLQEASAAWEAGLVPSLAPQPALMQGSALQGEEASAAALQSSGVHGLAGTGGSGDTSSAALAGDHELICGAMVALSRTLQSDSPPPKTLWNCAYAVRCVLPLCQILINAQRQWRRVARGMGKGPQHSANSPSAPARTTPVLQAAMSPTGPVGASKPWMRPKGGIPREAAPHGAGSPPSAAAAPSPAASTPEVVLADVRTPRTVSGPLGGAPVPDATWWMHQLLLSIAKLLRDSSNFKVRIAAAHAVSDVPTREVFGTVYEQVLHALMFAVDDAHRPVADFKDLKYQTALRNALRAALLQVICASLRSDYADSWQLLTERAQWLFNWLRSEEAAAAAADTEEEQAAASDREDAPAAVGAARAAAAVADAAAAAGLCASSSSVGAYVTPSGGVAFPVSVILRAYRQLTAMYESRVKTIPLSLLQQYQSRAFGQAS